MNCMAQIWGCLDCISTMEQPKPAMSRRLYRTDCTFVAMQVYDVFGLQYRMALSTRPEKYMGSPELWAKAEASLEDALNASGQQWEVHFRWSFARSICQPVVQFSASPATLFCARRTSFARRRHCRPLALNWTAFTCRRSWLQAPLCMQGCRLQICRCPGQLVVLAEFPHS